MRKRFSHVVRKFLQLIVGASVLASAIIHSAEAAVTVTATPSTISPGGSSTLSWNSGGLTSCTHNGTAMPNTGSATVKPTTTTTYTLVCQGGSGSATVNVLPSVTVSIAPNSVYVGQTATLSWSSTNATSCTYGGPSGSVTIGPTTQIGTHTVTVSCTGAGGTASGSATVSVAAAPAPTMTFSVSPSVIPVGGTTTWSWSSTNTTSCTYAGISFGPSGTLSGGPYTQPGTNQHTATCTGPGGSVSKTIQLTVTSPTPVQLSAGFDDRYQARTGDFNADGRADIYVALDLAVTDLPGVEGFYLLQDASHAFSLFDNLTPAQHSAGEQAALISSQVELHAHDLDGNGVDDLFLRNLSAAIPGANDVLVFASTVAGEPPSGHVEADEDFVSFFTQVRAWLNDPGYFHHTAIANGDAELVPQGPPILDYWRLDYLVSVGYGTGLNGDIPYVEDSNDVFNAEASIFGCNDPVNYQGFNSDCDFIDGVWWVLRTAQVYSIEIDFSDFNQDAIELIEPAVLNNFVFTDVGILRTVLAEGVDAGSSAAAVLAAVLNHVFKGNEVLAGVLAQGSYTVDWPIHYPGPDVVETASRKFVIPLWLTRILTGVGALVVPGNINDNWSLYHYANDFKKGEVLNVTHGLTPGASTGNIYFADEIYASGWHAKECLALPYQPPTGFWVFLQEGDVLATGPTVVAEQNFDAPPPFGDGMNYGDLKGGGNEWISVYPFVPVTPTKPFIKLPPDVLGRPASWAIDCTPGWDWF